MSPLEDEFAWFLSHKEELREKYDEQFVVIRGAEVIDSGADEIETIRRTMEKYPLGTFIVQKCEESPASYTQVFHSRVAKS